MSKVCDGGGGVRIDTYDGTEAIVLRDGGQPDGGLSLVAADFENDALRRRAGRDQRQEPRLTFGEESRRGANPRPRRVDGVGQIRWLTADG